MNVFLVRRCRCVAHSLVIQRGEFFDFGGEKQTRGTEKPGIDAFQGISGVEAFEIDDARGDDLLARFVLFADELDDVRVEDENLGVIVFGDRGRVRVRRPRGDVAQTNGHQLLPVE